MPSRPLDAHWSLGIRAFIGHCVIGHWSLVIGPWSLPYPCLLSPASCPVPCLLSCPLPPVPCLLSPVPWPLAPVPCPGLLMVQRDRTILHAFDPGHLGARHGGWSFILDGAVEGGFDVVAHDGAEDEQGVDINMAAGLGDLIPAKFTS